MKPTVDALPSGRGTGRVMYGQNRLVIGLVHHMLFSKRRRARRRVAHAIKAAVDALPDASNTAGGPLPPGRGTQRAQARQERMAKSVGDAARAQLLETLKQEDVDALEAPVVTVDDTPLAIASPPAAAPATPEVIVVEDGPTLLDVMRDIKSKTPPARPAPKRTRKKPAGVAPSEESGTGTDDMSLIDVMRTMRREGRAGSASTSATTKSDGGKAPAAHSQRAEARPSVPHIAGPGDASETGSSQAADAASPTAGGDTPTRTDNPFDEGFVETPRPQKTHARDVRASVPQLPPTPAGASAAELAVTQAALGEAQAELAAQEERYAELERKLTAARTEIDILKAQQAGLAAYETMFSEKLTENLQLNAELADKDRRISELELAAAEDERDRCEDAVLAQSTQPSAVEEAREPARERELLDRIAHLEKELESREGVVRRLEEHWREENKKCRDLEHEALLEAREKEQVSRSLADSKIEIARLDSELSTLRDATPEASPAPEDALLRSSLDDALAAEATARQAVASTQVRLVELETALEKHADEAAAAKQALAAAEAQLAAATARSTELEAAVAAAETVAERATDEAKLMESRYLAAEAGLSAAKAQAAAAEAQADAAKDAAAKEASAREMCDALREENDALREEGDARQLKIGELTLQLAQRGSASPVPSPSPSQTPDGAVMAGLRAQLQDRAAEVDALKEQLRMQADKTITQGEYHEAVNERNAYERKAMDYMRDITTLQAEVKQLRAGAETRADAETVVANNDASASPDLNEATAKIAMLEAQLRDAQAACNREKLASAAAKVMCDEFGSPAKLRVDLNEEKERNSQLTQANSQLCRMLGIDGEGGGDDDDDAGEGTTAAADVAAGRQSTASALSMNSPRMALFQSPTVPGDLQAVRRPVGTPPPELSDTRDGPEPKRRRLHSPKRAASPTDSELSEELLACSHSDPSPQTQSPVRSQAVAATPAPAHSQSLSQRLSQNPDLVACTPLPKLSQQQLSQSIARHGGKRYTRAQAAEILEEMRPAQFTSEDDEKLCSLKVLANVKKARSRAAEEKIFAEAAALLGREPQVVEAYVWSKKEHLAELGNLKSQQTPRRPGRGYNADEMELMRSVKRLLSSVRSKKVAEEITEQATEIMSEITGRKASALHEKLDEVSTDSE